MPKRKADELDRADSLASKLACSLTQAQRAILAELALLPEHAHAQFGRALMQHEATADASTSRERAGALDVVKETCETGPTFAAFGARAVELGYLMQAALDSIAARLASVPAARREEAVVVGMRRFIGPLMALGGSVQLVNSSVRHRMLPHLDLNGRLATVSGEPPGGHPERYNVLVHIPSEDDDPEDEPDPRHLIEAEPKELRPRPGRYDYDPNHARIPVSDDELADWFAEVVRNYELVERLGALRGRPKRPA